MLKLLRIIKHRVQNLKTKYQLKKKDRNCKLANMMANQKRFKNLMRVKI